MDRRAVTTAGAVESEGAAAEQGGCECRAWTHYHLPTLQRLGLGAYPRSPGARRVLAGRIAIFLHASDLDAAREVLTEADAR